MKTVLIAFYVLGVATHEPGRPPGVAFICAHSQAEAVVRARALKVPGWIITDSGVASGWTCNGAGRAVQAPVLRGKL